MKGYVDTYISPSRLLSSYASSFWRWIYEKGSGEILVVIALRNIGSCQCATSALVLLATLIIEACPLCVYDSLWHFQSRSYEAYERAFGALGVER